jgi:hypothetical protein
MSSHLAITKNTTNLQIAMPVEEPSTASIADIERIGPRSSFRQKADILSEAKHVRSLAPSDMNLLSNYFILNGNVSDRLFTLKTPLAYSQCIQ